MKVVNMGNIADAFKFDDLPATGIVIEATPKELKLLPNLAYKDVTISEHVSNAAAMREVAELRECLKEAIREKCPFTRMSCKHGEPCDYEYGTFKWRNALRKEGSEK